MAGSLFLLFLIFAAVSCLVLSSNIIDNENYSIWTIPDFPVNVLVNNTKTGAALIGGGSDCIPAFEMMISNANGGDFIILRASGADDYNNFVWELSKTIKKPLNSVTTILFKNREASFDSLVQEKIQNAEAVFFAGGDQSLYLKYWMDTPVQQIIQNKLLADTTVGGTSAGLAILGNYIYSAETGSVYSDECMENPYNIYVTISPHFLYIPYLQNLITDTHFSVRDRMGRMLTFMSRVSQDNELSVVHAAGVDETTALLLDINTGMVTTVGQGHAYVCTSSNYPAVCKAETELTFEGKKNNNNKK
jgi:cyanophycinase